jgi:DNA-binding transcriptional ArsR family regulator
MKNTDVYLSVLEDLKEIKARIDKIEARLNSELSEAGEKKGFMMTELLDLEAPLRTVVLELAKSGNATFLELSEWLGMDERTLARDLDTLKEMGYIREIVENGEEKYEAVMAKKKPGRVPLDLWSALEKKVRG